MPGSPQAVAHALEVMVFHYLYAVIVSRNPLVDGEDPAHADDGQDAVDALVSRRLRQGPAGGRRQGWPADPRALGFRRRVVPSGFPSVARPPPLRFAGANHLCPEVGERKAVASCRVADRQAGAEFGALSALGFCSRCQAWRFLSPSSAEGRGAEQKRGGVGPWWRHTPTPVRWREPLPLPEVERKRWPPVELRIGKPVSSLVLFLRQAFAVGAKFFALFAGEMKAADEPDLTLPEPACQGLFLENLAFPLPQLLGERCLVSARGGVGAFGGAEPVFHACRRHALPLPAP